MSFGKLDFNGKVWRASDLRPHVSIRFKDMFKGIRLSTLGLKASQSHGILNPFAGEAWATPTDDSRMRQLAKMVLGIEGEKDDD